MSKKKPYNIILEAYTLGMMSGISASANGKQTSEFVENQLNELAITYGYSGLTEFDKINISH